MNAGLELKLLRTFCAVADELHFRRAAGRLNTTQSAVSQQIRSLEHQVGAPLFERNRRGVELTEAGGTLLAEARVLLARAGAALASVREVARGRRGSITFGVIGAATFEALPRLIGEVREVAPDLIFQFREMTATEQFAALRDGLIDAGMVRAEPRVPDLELRTVLTEPVICLLPATHRLARQEAVTIAELEGEPILNLSRTHDPAAHDFYVGLYRQAGFEPRIVQEVSQIATIMFVIATTGCVALGPAGWRVLSRHGVAMRPLRPPAPTVTTRLVWNPDRVSAALGVVLACAARYR